MQRMVQQRMQTMRRILMAAGVAGLFASTATAQQWASLDCAKAKTAFARLVCSDAPLMKAYEALLMSTQSALERVPDGPVKGAFARDHFAWVRDRDSRCELEGKADAALEELSNAKRCLLDAFSSRLVNLRTQYPDHPPN